MDGNDQQGVNTRQAPEYAGTKHQKVIKPSASFVEELKDMPAESGQAIEQTPPTATQRSQPPVSAASIYPQPANRVGDLPTVSTPATHQGSFRSEPRLTDSKNQSKILAVRVVAAAIIALNLINVYDWYLEQRAGYTNIINILVICLVLALAVGIFKLNEAARSVYVLLSVVSLVLSCIGLITFYASTHQNGAFPANHQPLTRAQLENSLKAAENNTSLPAKARQEDIQQLQRQINNLSGSPTDLKVKQYLSTGILVVTAVGPLIFFTRPSIKEVFS